MRGVLCDIAKVACVRNAPATHPHALGHAWAAGGGTAGGLGRQPEPATQAHTTPGKRRHLRPRTRTLGGSTGADSPLPAQTRAHTFPMTPRTARAAWGGEGMRWKQTARHLSTCLMAPTLPSHVSPVVGTGPGRVGWGAGVELVASMLFRRERAAVLLSVVACWCANMSLCPSLAPRRRTPCKHPLAVATCTRAGGQHGRAQAPPGLHTRPRLPSDPPDSPRRMRPKGHAVQKKGTPLSTPPSPSPAWQRVTCAWNWAREGLIGCRCGTGGFHDSRERACGGAAVGGGTRRRNWHNLFVPGLPGPGPRPAARLGSCNRKLS